ncbi:hypothetical protein FOZ62_028732 [Perkinsus olseni]|uniref:Uncharacterized protein n=2 Tax=Perkinsus olseni TaxID=32597 RepID=A0A7J6TPJ1_PEROL|nr:hypothetical protein FOZ62_028732 [Perkinsus olseni]
METFDHRSRRGDLRGGLKRAQAFVYRFTMWSTEFALPSSCAHSLGMATIVLTVSYFFSLRLLLYRHCSLLEAFMHTPYTYAVAGLHCASGKRDVLQYFAESGLQRDSYNQVYISIPLPVRLNLIEKLKKYGNCRGLFEMTHYDFLRRDNSAAIQDGGPSAAGQVDHLNLSEISASDMAALVSSVLAAGASPMVDNEENEGVRTSFQCRRAFFDALDIIQNNNRGGVRTALLRGLNMLRQVVAQWPSICSRQAKYIRDRKMYNTLCGENGSFRITVLHGVINSVIYSAGVLRRLALFVLQIIHHKCSSREAGRSPLPYIICCRIPSGNYLCVGVMPTSVSKGTRDRR